jgi:hemoglobin
LSAWAAKRPCEALVDRFYDLMDLEPAYRELRAAHGTTLDERARQAVLVSLWLAGRAVVLHRPVRPSAAAGAAHALCHRHPERDQWLACMDQAMGETGVEPDLICASA